jgi:hypothetical protein
MTSTKVVEKPRFVSTPQKKKKKKKKKKLKEQEEKVIE